MATEDIRSGRKYIGKVLVEQGVIDQAQLDDSLDYAKATNRRIGNVLKERGLVDDDGIAKALSKQLSVPYIDLRGLEIIDEVLNLVPESLAERYLVLPVSISNGELTLAMGNPLDTFALADVRFVTQLALRIAVSPENQVLEAIGKHYLFRDNFNPFSLSDSEVQNDLQIMPESSGPKDEDERLDDLLDLSNKPPIIKFTNAVFIDAIKQKASDIHIEPREKSVLIRYRIDGVIRGIMETKRYIYSGVVNRIKVLADLDISVKRKPQDGRFKVQYAGVPIDMRVSTLPTAYGEKITIRVLNSQEGPESIEHLGFREQQLHRLKDAISKPQGLVLVTGPTGSGKSTTLHGCIKSLHTPEVNIVTLENPIEYQLEGINQVEVNPKQGLTFASGLRSILRQDPDIIFLGEIRDHETAEVAFHAGQTGHLVLSTLHTNNALATISRLVDLEIDSATIASGINAIVSQRLVRKLCVSCKSPAEVADPEHVSDSGFWEALGCEECEFTGYKGRLGIHEILLMTPSIKKLILDNQPLGVIEKTAIEEGMEYLHDDGVAKAKMGSTSLSEVYRVAPPPHKADIEEHSEDPPDDVPNLEQNIDHVDLDSENISLPVEPARPSKVLVVTSQEFMRHFLKGVLEGDGKLVITATDGDEAMRKTTTEAPDLLIIDLKLSGLNALELVGRIRSKLSTFYIPVIIIGEDSVEGQEIKSIDAGADDYFSTPINAIKLVSRAGRLLSRSHKN